MTVNEGWVRLLTNPPVPFRLSPGKHTLAVSYRLDDKARVTTPAAEFAVTADEWGEASGGIRAQLRLAKPTFKAGEPLAFELDLKNTGEKTYATTPIPPRCEVELNGNIYGYTGPITIAAPEYQFAPGKEHVPFVRATTDGLWRHARRGPTSRSSSPSLRAGTRCASRTRCPRRTT